MILARLIFSSSVDSTRGRTQSSSGIAGAQPAPRRRCRRFILASGSRCLMACRFFSTHPQLWYYCCCYRPPELVRHSSCINISIFTGSQINSHSKKDHSRDDPSAPQLQNHHPDTKTSTEQKPLSGGSGLKIMRDEQSLRTKTHATIPTATDRKTHCSKCARPFD